MVSGKKTIVSSTSDQNTGGNEQHTERQYTSNQLRTGTMNSMKHGVYYVEKKKNHQHFNEPRLYILSIPALSALDLLVCQTRMLYIVQRKSQVFFARSYMRLSPSV